MQAAVTAAFKATMISKLAKKPEIAEYSMWFCILISHRRGVVATVSWEYQLCPHLMSAVAD